MVGWLLDLTVAQEAVEVPLEDGADNADPAVMLQSRDLRIVDPGCHGQGFALIHFDGNWNHGKVGLAV